MRRLNRGHHVEGETKSNFWRPYPKLNEANLEAISDILGTTDTGMTRLGIERYLREPIAARVVEKIIRVSHSGYFRDESTGICVKHPEL
jgi:hypothetical protein